MNKHYIINEVRWQDFFGKGFKEFRKKYMNSKGLYVNFSNFRDNTIDKTFSNKPSHSDPTGLYVYKIEYVINHPSDLRYGNQANYLRVIESHSKTPLHLDRLDDSSAKYFLGRVGINSYQMELAQKKFKFPRNINQIAKQFFACVQHDFNQEAKHRTNQEQADLLIKMGFDSVVDDSKNNKQAVINQWEPEQIIFLTRNSFKVIDYFEMSNAKETTFSSRTSKENLRKILSTVLEGIGDKIKNRFSDSVFITVKGFLAEINSGITEEYMKNKKFGEKKHKEFKLFNHETISIKLKTDRGDFGFKFNPEDSAKEMTSDISSAYNKASENKDFKPYTLEAYKNDIDQKSKENLDSYLAKEKEKRELENKQLGNLIEKVAKHLGMTYQAQDLDYTGIFNTADFNLKKSGNWDIFWENYEQNYKSLLAVDEIEEFDDIYYLASPKGTKLKEIYKKVYEKSNHYHSFYFNANDFLRSFD